MTIGILTIHTGFNEGAVLQALALSRLLTEVTGQAVEIVDHQYSRLLEKAHGAKESGRRTAIGAFRDSQLTLSPDRFEDNHRAAWAYAAKRYGSLVVGSDEVLKVNYTRRFKGLVTVQKDPLAPAYPNVYWPDESAGRIRIAYAATAGTKTDWTKIPFLHRRRMRRAISGFAALGLRDERTRRFLDAIAPEAAERSVRVPDPTLGFDLLAEAPAMHERLAALGVEFSRPRAVFVAAPNPKTDELVAGLRARGVQTVAISYPNPAVDLDISDASFTPLDWAAAFGAFDLAVTDRMHGAIFALRNGTPLIVLDARRRTMGLPTKNEELAARFGIAEFYFPLHHGSTHGADLVAAADRLRTGDWPIDSLRARLASERALAVDFLQKAFKSGARHAPLAVQAQSRAEA